MLALSLPGYRTTVDGTIIIGLGQAGRPAAFHGAPPPSSIAAVMEISGQVEAQKWTLDNLVSQLFPLLSFVLRNTMRNEEVPVQRRHFSYFAVQLNGIQRLLVVEKRCLITRIRLFLFSNDY